MKRLRWSEVPRDRKFVLAGFAFSFLFCTWLCIHFAAKIDKTWADTFFGVCAGCFALCFIVFLAAAVRVLFLPQKQSVRDASKEPASKTVDTGEPWTPVSFFMDEKSRERTDKICRYFEAKDYVEVMNLGMSWTFACVTHVEEGGEVLFRFSDGSVKVVKEFSKSEQIPGT